MTEMNISMIITFCVINAILSCTTIMLNFVTILALGKTLSEVPENFKILLLSMSVSDFGVGLFVQPLYIKLYAMLLEQNYEKYEAVRKAYYILTNLLCLTSFLSVTLLIVDRILAIHLHLRYQEVVTRKRIVVAVISIWVFAPFLALLELSISATLLIVIAIIFIVCLTATGLFTCKIYLVARWLANRLQEMQVPQAAHAQNDTALENNARHRKSAAAAIYVYLVFLGCYLPNICILVVMIILKPEPGVIPLWIEIYGDTLGFLNSSLNPLIYCWKVAHIRQAIKDVLRNIYPSHD